MYVIELPRADVHGAFCLEHQMHAFARPPSLHWRLYSRYKNLALSGVLALCFPPLSRPIMSDPTFDTCYPNWELANQQDTQLQVSFGAALMTGVYSFLVVAFAVAAHQLR